MTLMVVNVGFAVHFRAPAQWARHALVGLEVVVLELGLFLSDLNQWNTHVRFDLLSACHSRARQLLLRVGLRGLYGIPSGFVGTHTSFRVIAAGCIWALFDLRGLAPCCGLDIFFMSTFQGTRGDVEVLLRTRAWFADATWPLLDARERAHVCRPRRIDHLFSVLSSVSVDAVPLVVID